VAGRKPNWQRKKQIESAVLTALPEIPDDKLVASEPEKEGAKKRMHLIVRSGLTQQVVWLRFLGYSNRAIAYRLRVSDDSVDRYTRTDDFRALYEHEREGLLARVDEGLRERIQEVAMEALGIKIEMMQNVSTNKFLRNKICNEILELQGKYHGGSGRPSDAVWALYQESKRVIEADGSITTQTAKIKGPASQIPPPSVAFGGGDDKAGNRQGAGANGGSGVVGALGGPAKNEGRS
jgi:hypothetical protein